MAALAWSIAQTNRRVLRPVGDVAALVGNRRRSDRWYVRSLRTVGRSAFQYHRSRLLRAAREARGFGSVVLFEGKVGLTDIPGSGAGA